MNENIRCVYCKFCKSAECHFHPPTYVHAEKKSYFPLVRLYEDWCSKFIKRIDD